jgi:hypothetical protein
VPGKYRTAARTSGVDKYKQVTDYAGSQVYEDGMWYDMRLYIRRETYYLPR